MAYIGFIRATACVLAVYKMQFVDDEEKLESHVCDRRSFLRAQFNDFVFLTIFE